MSLRVANEYLAIIAIVMVATHTIGAITVAVGGLTVGSGGDKHGSG